MEVGRIYLRHTRNFCAKSLKEATGYLRQTPSAFLRVLVLGGLHEPPTVKIGGYSKAPTNFVHFLTKTRMYLDFP